MPAEFVYATTIGRNGGSDEAVEAETLSSQLVSRNKAWMSPRNRVPDPSHVWNRCYLATRGTPKVPIGAVRRLHFPVPARTVFVLLRTDYILLMADIELTRSHSMGLDDGRGTVESVAQKLEEKLGVEYAWDDDNTLAFEGQGAEGQIDVEADAIQIRIHLSAFLRPMKGQLEKKAKTYLDEHMKD